MPTKSSDTRWREYRSARYLRRDGMPPKAGAAIYMKYFDALFLSQLSARPYAYAAIEKSDAEKHEIV